MALIDRFIKLPIKIYDKEKATLVGKAEFEDTEMYVLPFEISNFKIIHDEENDNCECVSLSLKNGDNFYVYMTLKEFKKILNSYAI